MAKYHDIDSDIWEELLEYRPNHKLLYIYLFSNPLCRPSGLYVVKPQTIKHHTNQGEKDIKSICGKLIDYDFETCEVFVRGKLKRILGGFKNNENMKKAVKADFDGISSVSIKHSFYKKYEGALKGLASPPLPLPLPLPLPKDRGVGKGENPENQTDELAISEKQFEELWRKYPNPVGKKHAKRHFTASVKSLDDYARISLALENYLRSKNVLAGFVKNGSTWFNEWEDWVNFTEVQTPQSKDDEVLRKLGVG